MRTPRQDPLPSATWPHAPRPQVTASVGHDVCETRASAAPNSRQLPDASGAQDTSNLSPQELRPCNFRVTFLGHRASLLGSERARPQGRGAEEEERDRISMLLRPISKYNQSSLQEIAQEYISTLFRSWFIDFDPVKAKAEGKVVIVSSWIKYCTSCASQMKALDKAKNDFDNIEYFAFDVTNKEIAELFDVQYQTTLLIFKDKKLVYRSIGETSKDLIYKAIQSSI